MFITTKILDKGVLELLGPRGLTQVLTNTSNKIVSFDTGSITQYALFIFISAVGLIVTVFYLDDPRYFILYLITTSLIPLNKNEQGITPSITKNLNNNRYYSLARIESEGEGENLIILLIRFVLFNVLLYDNPVCF